MVYYCLLQTQTSTFTIRPTLKSRNAQRNEKTLSFVFLLYLIYILYLNFSIASVCQIQFSSSIFSNNKNYIINSFFVHFTHYTIHTLTLIVITLFASLTFNLCVCVCSCIKVFIFFLSFVRVFLQCLYLICQTRSHFWHSNGFFLSHLSCYHTLFFVIIIMLSI